MCLLCGFASSGCAVMHPEERLCLLVWWWQMGADSRVTPSWVWGRWHGRRQRWLLEAPSRTGREPGVQASPPRCVSRELWVLWGSQICLAADFKSHFDSYSFIWEIIKQALDHTVNSFGKKSWTFKDKLCSWWEYLRCHEKPEAKGHATEPSYNAARPADVSLKGQGLLVSIVTRTPKVGHDVMKLNRGAKSSFWPRQQKNDVTCAVSVEAPAAKTRLAQRRTLFPEVGTRDRWWPNLGTVPAGRCPTPENEGAAGVEGVAGPLWALGELCWTGLRAADHGCEDSMVWCGGDGGGTVNQTSPLPALWSPAPVPIGWSLRKPKHRERGWCSGEVRGAEGREGLRAKQHQPALTALTLRPYIF